MVKMLCALFEVRTIYSLVDWMPLGAVRFYRRQNEGTIPHLIATMLIREQLLKFYTFHDRLFIATHHALYFEPAAT